MNTRAPITDVELSRAWFLRTLLVHLAPISEAILGSDGARSYLRRVALTIADAVEQHAPALAERVSPMTPEDFAAFALDFKERLGGIFTVETVDDDVLHLIAERCPWGDVTPHLPGVCALLRAVYGWLAARQFGYAKVVHTERGDTGGAGCRMAIYIRPGAEAARHAGEEFLPDGGSLASESTPEALLQRYREEIDELRTAPEDFLRCHLAAAQRLERALDAERAAHEQLRVAARVKEDFLANVSHELRTPITAIQGYLDLLEQGVLGAVNPEQLQALQTAHRNLERLHAMVRDLLDYSALTRGTCHLPMAPVEVTEVLEASLERVAATARERCITLEARFPAHAGRVLGDAEKLIQVVAHLLENAAKFSEPGRAVALDAAVEGRQVQVEVSDHGIGMTPEQLRHVFAPFVQGESGLNRRYGGLGMGLSLIRNLVQLHGGEIVIASTPGSGTTARVTLPLLDAA